MTTTEAKIWTRAELEALSRHSLKEVAMAAGLAFGKNTRSTSRITMVLSSQIPDPDALGERPDDAEPDDLVNRLRTFLANPHAVGEEEATEIQRWMFDAPRDRYAEVMEIVRPVPRETPREPHVAPVGSECVCGRPWDDPIHIHDVPVGEARDEDAPATGVAIERWQHSSLLPSLNTWQQIQVIAEDLSRAVTLPGALRGKPADIALLLLTGRDLGIAPTVALNKVYVIDGKPSMAPELMRALIVDRGHFFRVQSTPTSATVRYRRNEWPPDAVGEVTFTLADAQRARLIQSFDEDGTVRPMEKKEVWAKYPRAMLAARATSEAGRLDFADVLAGVSYVPEELDSDVDESGAPLRVESTATVHRGPRDETGTPAPAPDRLAELDAAAQAAGWESNPAEAKAHKLVAERVRTLTDDQQAQAKALIGISGWPVRPKPRFDAFVQWVDRAVMAKTQEAKPPAAPDSPAARAAREALRDASEADAPVGKEVKSYEGRKTETVAAPAVSGDPTAGPEDAELVCPECGMSAPMAETIEHEVSCSKG